MELIIGGGVATFIIYACLNWRETHEKKIKHIFQNVNYKANDRYPRLHKKRKTDTHTDYIYNVPYGLIDDNKLQPILQKTLQYPTEVLFNGKLIIRVYKYNLTTHIDYDWQPTKGWTIPLHSHTKNYHDFDKIPHMTVSGTTRYGKTVLLKLIFAHLIISNPKHAEFYIVDMKGGLEFGRYSNLKQVNRVTSTVFDTKDMLSEVLNDIEYYMSHFKSNGYNNVLNTDIKTRKFIIVDEAAELNPKRHHTKEEKQTHNACVEMLSEIARVGGGLGYRLIYATQYPTSETLPRSVKQNADAKITFRLPTEVASRVAIDEKGAEDIHHPGRAIYRTAYKNTVQIPYIDDKDIINKLEGYRVTDRKKDTTSRKNTIDIG